MLVSSKASLKYLSIPPRKMRLVADNVKGMPVEKALAALNFTPKIAAHHLAKTVKSAAANALSQEGTDHLHPEDLLIKNIIVDAAPTQKRIRFRSMGRVFRYHKRFCHLTVFVEGHTDVEAEQKVSTKTKKKVADKDAKAADSSDKKPAVAKKKTAKKTAAKKKTAVKKTAKAADKNES